LARVVGTMQRLVLRLGNVQWKLKEKAKGERPSENLRSLSLLPRSQLWWRSTVQNRVVPGRWENAIRTSTNLLGLLAVPVLLLLGCMTWVKTSREKLSV